MFTRARLFAFLISVSAALPEFTKKNITMHVKIFLQGTHLFFSSRLVSVQVVHPYSSIDTTAAWKKLRFILSVRST